MLLVFEETESNSNLSGRAVIYERRESNQKFSEIYDIVVVGIEEHE